MEGMCISFKPDDLLQSQNRKLLDTVSGIWDLCVAPERDYSSRRDVILVDLGCWLKQESWQDLTGHFMKFRLHPSHCHLPSVKEKGRAVLKAFIDSFPGRKNVQVENEDALYDGNEKTVTVSIQTGSFNIGD